MLLLDECVSPKVSQALWDAGIDNYSVRDRGLTQSPDHALFTRAVAEGRAVVTINAIDFCRLASRAEEHFGLVILPNGASREEQLRFILRAVEWAREQNADDLRNLVITVSEEGAVTAERVCATPLAALPDPSEGGDPAER